ncbi:hypothetical protein B7463_g11158, partial [Scytalidium lignicola]
MALSFSKAQVSLASATQETTLALANLNFDFSLVKVDAPAEFKDVGTALTNRRRAAAENGSAHRLARKLGHLFESIIPPIPNLIRAYGLRASEISNTPSINGKGWQFQGPFKDFVWVDGTSIWAAATSGPSSIAVHLLACMLARVWSSSEAASIWEELVLERKKELSRYENVESLNLKDVVATELSISKEELSEWDASARSWLRAADDVDLTRKRQKQLMLILGDINLPVGRQLDVYGGVTKSWRTALKTMDKIVSGEAYSITDGAVLVALSAWHLYPDMLVLGKMNQEIKQGDDLSLSLANLRYYSAPVLSSKSIGTATSRLDADQFTLVVLGCVIGSWNISFHRLHDGIKLILEIGRVIEMALTNLLDTQLCSAITKTSWIIILVNAARKFDQSTKEEQESSKRLLGLGFRLYEFITGGLTDVFGLRSHKLFHLIAEQKDKIAFLRRIMASHKMPSGSFIIRISGAISANVGNIGVQNNGSVNSQRDSFQLATVFPFAVGQNLGRKHVRWIAADSGYDNDIYATNANERSVSSDDVHIVNIKDLTLRKEHFRWRNPHPFFKAPSEQVTLHQEERHQKDHTDSELKAPTSARQAKVEKRSSRKEDKAAHRGGGKSKPKRVSWQRLGLSDRELFNDSRNIEAPQHNRFGLVDEKNGDEAANKQAMEIEKVVSYSFSAGDPNGVSLFQRTDDKEGVAVKFRNLLPLKLSRSSTFACIIMLESGGFDLDPHDLQHAMAVSSENSLYIAAPLLCDPLTELEAHEVRRVVGNIGRPGVAVLIPPVNPKVRSLQISKWNIINHAPFDGNLADCFRSTSLHLSFSGYELPIMTSEHGGRFVEAFFLEAIVSVHDSGEWVADLDILAALSSPLWKPVLRQPQCDPKPVGQHKPSFEMTSIDCWEELLEKPRCIVAVRAHGNWQARLAAAAISIQKGNPTILFRGHGCWACGLVAMGGVFRPQELFVYDKLAQENGTSTPNSASSNGTDESDWPSDSDWAYDLQQDSLSNIYHLFKSNGDLLDGPTFIL